MAEERVTTQQETKRRPRGGECLCCACGVFFTSLSAFDTHQRAAGRRGKRTGTPGVVCRDPAECGLVVYQRAGGPTWGAPGEDNQRFGRA